MIIHLKTVDHKDGLNIYENKKIVKEYLQMQIIFLRLCLLGKYRQSGMVFYMCF
jgi:hypothetical protein